MLPQRRAARQALGAGGAHKVFAQHVEHGRARDARQDGRLHHGQRYGRQQQRLQRFQRVIAPAGKTASGKPLQPNRKQQDQQDGKPEIRNRDADLGQSHQADIAPLVMARSRVHAGHQRDQHRQYHRQQRQRDGELQPLGNQLGHRCAIGIAVAHVALQQTADPMGVADAGRLVQAQLLGQRLHRFRRCVRSHQHFGCIAGQHLQRPKNRHRRHDQGGDQREQAFEQEQAHGGEGRAMRHYQHKRERAWCGPRVRRGQSPRAELRQSLQADQGARDLTPAAPAPIPPSGSDPARPEAINGDCGPHASGL